MKNKHTSNQPKRGRGRPRKHRPEKVKKIFKMKKKQQEENKQQNVQQEQRNDTNKKQQPKTIEKDKQQQQEKQKVFDQRQEFKLLISGLNKLKNILKSDSRKKKRYILEFDDELDQLKHNVRFKKLNENQQKKLFRIIKKIRNLENFQISKTFEKIWKKVQNKYSKQQANQNEIQSNSAKELNLLQVSSPQKNQQNSHRKKSNKKKQNSEIKSKRIRKHIQQSQEREKQIIQNEKFLVKNQESLSDDIQSQKDITSLNDQTSSVNNQKPSKEIFKNDHSILTFGNSIDTPVKQKQTELKQQKQNNSQCISEQENIFQMELSFQQELDNKKDKNNQKRQQKIDKSEYQALQKYQHQKEDEIEVVLDPKKLSFNKKKDIRNSKLSLMKKPLKNKRFTIEVSSSSVKQIVKQIQILIWNFLSFLSTFGFILLLFPYIILLYVTTSTFGLFNYGVNEVNAIGTSNFAFNKAGFNLRSTFSKNLQCLHKKIQKKIQKSIIIFILNYKLRVFFNQQNQKKFQ